jgi:hypothetical protein
MAKTYNSISTFTSGQILTATQMNEIGTNVNNYRVPTMCSLYRNAALNHASNNAYVAVPWDAQEFTQTDTGMWAATPNPERISLTTAGVYILTATVATGNSATGLRAIRFTKDGADFSYATVVAGIATGNYMTASAVVTSTGSNYVECSVYQNSGGTLAYTVGAAYMRFSAVWVGQVS